MLIKILLKMGILDRNMQRTISFPCGSTAKFWALAASMKLSVSFQLLDLGQSAGLLGRVISSSQGSTGQ
jgi:hypothetical protein